MKDYQKSITVNNTAEAVYNCLTQHIPDWWSDDFTGAAAKFGDQYNIAFGETKKTFEIAEAIPNRQITWLCLQAHVSMDTLTKKMNGWEQRSSGLSQTEMTALCLPCCTRA